MSLLEMYTVAVVHVGLFPVCLFPFYYARRPWKTTEAGRAVMTVSIALAVLWSVSVLGFWWPFPGYTLIYAVTVTAVVGALTYHFAVMRKARNR